MKELEILMKAWKAYLEMILEIENSIKSSTVSHRSIQLRLSKEGMYTGLCAYLVYTTKDSESEARLEIKRLIYEIISEMRFNAYYAPAVHKAFTVKETIYLLEKRIELIQKVIDKLYK